MPSSASADASRPVRASDVALDVERAVAEPVEVAPVDRVVVVEPEEPLVVVRDVDVLGGVGLSVVPWREVLLVAGRSVGAVERALVEPELGNGS